MAYGFSGDLLKRMAENLRKVQYLWMDDWYVTHALLNGTNTIYVDIGKHYISTNNQIELDRLQNSTLKYHPIFAHFRPVKR
jgi:hypothetical protein